MEQTLPSDYKIACVAAVNKDSFQIRNKKRDIFAEATGKMLFNTNSPTNFPTVDDWVYPQFYDNESFAIIHKIISRKSFLKRKNSRKKTEYQLIFANIDTAFIIQLFVSDYNLRRLEKYLVMVKEGNIQPVVLLSKSDLSTENERDKKLLIFRYQCRTCRLLSSSNINYHGINRIKDMLIPEE